jgi:hypothetical protein
MRYKVFYSVNIKFNVVTSWSLLTDRTANIWKDPLTDETLVGLSNYEMHCTTNRKHQNLQESVKFFKMLIILGVCLCTSLRFLLQKDQLLKYFKLQYQPTHIIKIIPSTTYRPSSAIISRSFFKSDTKITINSICRHVTIMLELQLTLTPLHNYFIHVCQTYHTIFLSSRYQLF